MNRNVPSHHKPMAELVEPVPGPRPYTIVDTIGKPWLPTNGMANLKERVLYVPLSAQGRAVARHELAHVKWSPVELPKLPFDARYVLAVEDARLNLGLAKIDLPVLLDERERQVVARLAREDLERRDLLAFVLRAIAAQGTNAEEAVLRELAPRSAAVRDLAYGHVRRIRIELLRARRARQAPVAEFAVVVRLARELARQIEPELEALGFARGLLFPMELLGEGCCLSHGSPGAGFLARKGKGAKAEEETGGEDRSGTLSVRTAPLVHEARSPRCGARGRGRAVCEGTLPRHLHRWSIDRAIFRHTSSRRGGAVLVDVSGSMKLDAAEIDQVLMASFGAALIAIYSGREDVGELRIVARDGRRADARDLVPFGRGNIVDEPALEWLARQPGPRLWISDGGVTGIGDKVLRGVRQRCEELVKRAGIVRVKTVSEAARILAKGGRHAGVA